MARDETHGEGAIERLVRTGGLDASGSPAGSAGDGAVEADPLRSAPDECLVIDREGRIVDANDCALRQLGYRAEELIGRAIWEIGTRQTREGFQKVLEALDAEGPQFLFGHNRRKDGSTYAVEARLWSGVWGGEPHIFALIRDSSGSQGLIEERDQLISLIENSAEMICVADPEGSITYMNPAGAELLGLVDASEMTGHGLRELFPDSERNRLDAEVLPTIRSGRWRGELPLRGFGGTDATPAWVNAFSIQHSQTREVIGLAVIAHDITERKAAERQREKLLALNEVSRKVATSLLEHDDLNRAIGIVLSGVGRILGVSRSYLCRYREDRRWVFRTHQWTEEEGDIHLIEPHPEPSEGYTWATDLLAKGKPIRIPNVAESGIVPKEGSGVLRPDVRALLVLPVIIHGRLESFFGFVDTSATRDWEDEELALLGIIVDSYARAIERRIAEREREVISEDLAKSVERERAANRYKSEFLANMSHELRTPMNAIVGYAELLSRSNVDRKKQETWARNIRRSTGYLLSLINDVLDLSKIEAGEMQVSHEPCCVRDLIAEVLELLARQAREKMLELSMSVAEEVPDCVLTDPMRLKQILVNLVGNAIKFTNEGRVEVRLALAGEERDALLFEVVDTGIGIAPEALRDLFRPFSQVNPSRDTRFGGAGLGLDICRHLARLLGGMVTVESEVGQGSCFAVRLPLVPAGEEARETCKALSREGFGVASPPERTFAGRRLLIVDDSPENQEVLRFLLEESGAEVETADDGQSGVETVLAAKRNGRAFDAILMDMNMPVLDGYEATRRLVAAGIEEPVIALTALALSGDEERCREAGCSGYISKPVVPSLFFETISRHLARPGEKAGGEEPATVPAAGGGEDVFSLSDNPRFRPLVERYLASFETLWPEIEGLHRDGELESLRTRVHRLRGTASNYGFPAISAAAGRCEDLIRAGGGETELSEALAELGALLAAARIPPG